MSQARAQQAIIQDVPRDKQMTDKDGYILPHWDLYFQSLTQALQTILKPEGLVIPQQNSANIANLGDTDASVGNIIYDSTTNEFKGIVLVSIGPPIVTATKTFYIL